MMAHGLSQRIWKPGDYELRARALDADGNVAAEADSISLSVGEALAAPSIDLPSAGLAAGAITLTGLGTPGSEIDVMVDGVSVGTTTVGDDGTWSLDADLPEGDVDFSLSATRGEETAVSDPISFSIDPRFVAPTLNLPAGELTAGTVNLTGTGTPGSTVDVTVDGEVVGTTTVGDDGNWSFDLDWPEGGDYEIGARTLDADGNIAAEMDPIAFSLAGLSALAMPSIDWPEFDFPTGPFALSGNGRPGDEIEVVVDGEVVGTTTVGEDGTWSFDLDLPEGEYDLATRAYDANGNLLAETDANTITVSADAPGATAGGLDLSIPEINFPEFGFPAGLFSLTGKGQPGSEVEVVVDGEVVGKTIVGEDGTWSFDLDLPEGEYEVATRAYDADGNLLAETDPEPLSVSTLDIQVPVVELPEGGFSVGAASLSGTGTPGTDIEIVVDGEVVGKTKVGDDGTWSFDLDLPEGDYEVAVQAVDANGQVITSSNSSLISLNPAGDTAPLAITEPMDGATLQSGELTLTGIGTPGAEIEILDNGEVIGTAVIGDDGTWSYSFEPEPGNHEYGVRNVGDDAAASSVMTTIETPMTDTSAVGICDNPEPGIDQGDTYVVGECEWLIRIANRLGIEYDSLIGVNPQIENPNVIYPGQIINLPPR